MSNKCQFDKAWVGKCGKPVEEGEEYCEEHLGLECDSCGNQATHSCYETMGAFVCGAPLCDDCEHKIFADGTNGGKIAHVKKSEQVNEPWYVQEMNKNNDKN